jgi:hypothetical protein
MTTTSLLDKLAEREQAVRTHANYLRVQIDELNGQMSEPEAEFADLATTRKVLLTLEPDEYEHPGSTSCPTIPSTSTSSPSSPTPTGPCAPKTCARRSTSDSSRSTSRGCAPSSSGSSPAV